MTKQAAISEAKEYVAKLVEAQEKLGYKRPSQSVVKSAVSEAANAMKALSALSARS
jgi:hypothetical protein